MNRFADGASVQGETASGWSLARVTPASGLYGANGLQFDPAGRLCVAQLLGNRVSAIVPDTGATEVIVELGGPVAAPDDIAFDARGVMYIADNMPGSVWALSPDGTLRSVAGDLPAANGITCHGDRLFVNECRPGGRLLELFPAGGPPRVLADELMAPNAMSVGPDGLLYFPLVIPGEIWRVSLDGGTPERFVDGLTVPTAVKFDRTDRLTVTCGATGEVVSVALDTRRMTTVARLRPGLDNLAFDSDGRLFVSHFVDGGVTEVRPDGDQRAVVPPGFVGPADLVALSNGTVVVADGSSLVMVNGGVERRSTILDHGFPGVVRGLAAARDGGLYVTTTGGDVAAYDVEAGASRVLARGLEELMGAAVTPEGEVLAAEAGAGRVLSIAPDGELTELARGLARPTGVAVSAEGRCLVAESGSGRILSIGRERSVCLAGLQEPHGIAVHDGELFVVDAARKELIVSSLATGDRSVVAARLPVGAPEGKRMTPHCGTQPFMPGPLTSFSGVSVAPDGTVYLGADGEGSLLAVRRTRPPDTTEKRGP